MAALSSSQVLENIHEQLVCAICLERFDDPKLLNCLHSFCCQCLHKIINQKPSDVIECPTCREVTIIPINGIKELKTNFFINSLLDLVHHKIEELKNEKKKGEQCEQCQEHDNATSRCIECDLVLCGGCIADHRRNRSTLDHRIVVMEDDEDVNKQSLDKYTLTFCRYHTRNVIKYFCNTCDEAVCRVCTILEHREHQFVYPKDAIPQQKPIIEELLEKTKENIPLLKATIKDIHSMSNTLRECRESLLLEINAKTQARIEALLLAKAKLLEELDRIHRGKQKTLSLQSDAVELELGKISGCCAFAENVLKFGNEVEVLQIKSRLQQLNSITIKLDPEEDDSIQYVSESESIEAVMESLGKICSSQTFASLSYAEGEGLETPRVGIESNIIVHAQNRHGKKKSGSDRVEAVMVLPDETKRTLNALDNDDGTYTIRFTPDINGRHLLHITIKTKPINGSPFEIFVINRREYSEVGPSLLKFGQYGSKRREFKSPFGVASDNEGFIYVADSYNHRIQTFGPRGEFVHMFGSHGDRKGEFNCPTDVAVSPNSKLVVCDNGNNRVQVFGRNGNFIAKFGREGIKNGNFKSPWGVTVSPVSREIIVADTDNHRIQIFSSDGKFIMKFGCNGDRPGQFNSPCYVAANAENEHILVSDSKNHRIQIFDRRGKFIQLFGTQGQEDGQFNHPRGLSMDIANNIIVSDMGNHRLQILTYAGKMVKCVGTEGNGDGQLSFPESVAVTPNGFIIVSDLSNNRIQVF
ncbi:E3 ubiquitin-protein ligase TRIM71 [Hydra vulgaris]|uniref:E3 ubiquitin-protein ligase TRIM71 n=1 Tax=Hydra vulgaris TaxID=6087 RepID=A0ABM4D9F4_HYDVU